MGEILAGREPFIEKAAKNSAIETMARRVESFIGFLDEQIDL